MTRVAAHGSGTLALALSDVSLTVMLVGAIVLAGATVVITAIPNWSLPRRFRRSSARAARSSSAVTSQLPVAQRRVVTGRAPVLQPAAARSSAPTPARQARALPDGRRPAGIDVTVAEAVIDRYLDADPEMLAKTISAWLAADDRPRRPPT